jgi:hypothetical protein
MTLRIKSVFLASLVCLSLIGTTFWATQQVPAIAQLPTISNSTSIGIALEGLPYPHPVQFLNLTIEGQPVRMGYMDIQASDRANG